MISQQLLGTEAIIILHHTDCGMLTFDNATLQGICQERLGADATDIDFLPFGDLEQSVRDDIEVIRSSPLIPDDIPVTGFIYDVKTGKIATAFDLSGNNRDATGPAVEGRWATGASRIVLVGAPTA